MLVLSHECCLSLLTLCSYLQPLSLTHQKPRISDDLNYNYLNNYCQGLRHIPSGNNPAYLLLLSSGYIASLRIPWGQQQPGGAAPRSETAGSGAQAALSDSGTVDILRHTWPEESQHISALEPGDPPQLSGQPERSRGDCNIRGETYAKASSRSFDFCFCGKI
jgi:hypothetical protein